MDDRVRENKTISRAIAFVGKDSCIASAEYLKKDYIVNSAKAMTWLLASNKTLALFLSLISFIVFIQL